MVLKQASSRVYWMSADFKEAHYPKSVILYAVYFYVRYGVSYRDLEEIMAERGTDVDHTTLNRWVINFSPMIAANAQARKRPTAISWRMDKTYIKVKGRWTYYYRAVDKTGKTLDFMLSERRDKAAARRSESEQLAPMACRFGSLSTRAGPIWRAWKALTSS
jgi:putative transposase